MIIKADVDNLNLNDQTMSEHKSHEGRKNIKRTDSK